MNASFTKGPIEAVLALIEEGHYPTHVANTMRAMGFTELPAKMSLPRDAVLAEYIHVRRQHEDHTQDEAIARAVARVAWRQHVRPKAHPEFVRRIDRDRRLLWVWRIILLLGVLGILGLLLARPAHAQIDVIKFKDSGGATLKTYAAPFSIQCSTNITCTPSGSTMAISSASTASTAWSAITAAANVNAGAFSASGNSWDFTGATFFKLRVGTGLTTSANGDIGQNSTDGVWHAWVNGADRLLIGSTNKGVAGQVPISNADGTATFADPIVSPNQDTASTTAWTSATALNTALSAAVSQRSTVTVSFNGSSITGGAVTFEVSPDNTTWYAKAGVRGDAGAFETTYTLTGANQSWTFAVGGYTNFRVRLSTVITGAGTANVNVIPQALGSPNLSAVLANITSALPTGANTIGGVNLAQYTPVAGRLPVDGSGVTQPVSGAVTANQGGTWTVQPGNTANTTAWKVDGSAVTQPVSGTVTTSPPANASTNVTQFGGVAVATGTGASGTGIPRVTVSNDSTVGLVAGAAIVGKVGIDQTTAGTTSGISMAQPTRTTGTVTSATSVVGPVTVNGYGVSTVTVNGTYAGVTINFEFSDDGGTIWYSDTCTRTDTSIQEGSEALPSNQTRAWNCSVYAASNFRVRASAWTSGTANVGITLSAAPVEAAPTVSLAAGTNTIGALSANQSVNLAQVGGSGVVTGTGASGAGIPRVTVSNDSSLAGTLADNGVAAATNRLGTLPAIARTNLPAAATAGRDAALNTGLHGVLRSTVLPETDLTTYAANKVGLASVASATDIAILPGNATNTVLVTRVQVTCTQTTAGIIDLQLIKRSTADTLGTSSAMTIVPLDSNDAAAVSAPLTYTANPTVGTAVGNVDSAKLGCMAPGTATPSDIYIWKPGMGQSVALRGTTQQLAVNLNGVTVTGSSFNITFQWIETTGL